MITYFRTRYSGYKSLPKFTSHRIGVWVYEARRSRVAVLKVFLGYISKVKKVRKIQGSLGLFYVSYKLMGVLVKCGSRIMR